MDFVRYEATLARPSATGSAESAHLARAAASGRPTAATAILDAQPPEPDALGYLLEWSRELHGRSGIGMHGADPLRYSEISAWATLTGREPAPHEVDALILLDAVRRHPDPLPERDA